MKKIILTPLAIFMICIVTSYTSAKHLLLAGKTQHRTGQRAFSHKSFQLPTEKKRLLPRFKRFRGKSAPRVRRRGAFAPVNRRSFGQQKNPRGLPAPSQAVKKPSSQAKPQNELENGILLFMEAEIAPIAQQLTQAIGSAEMQAASTGQGANTQKRGAFGRFGSKGRTPFGRSTTQRKPFGSFSHQGKVPVRRPFGSFGRRPSPFGRRPSAFGASKAFGGFGSPRKTSSLGSRSPVAGKKSSSSSLGSSKGSKPSTSKSPTAEKPSSSSGSSYVAPAKKDDKQEEQHNKVRNIRRELESKMKKINSQFEDSATRIEARRQLDNTLFASLKNQLAELKTAKDQLSSKAREKLRKQLVNIATYKKFLGNMLDSFPTIALAGGDGLIGFESLFHEIEESVGDKVIKARSAQFLSRFVLAQNSRLKKKKQSKDEKKKAAEDVLARTQIIKSKYPSLPSDITALNKLEALAQKKVKQSDS